MEFKKLDICGAIEATIGEVGSVITHENLRESIAKLHGMINKHIQYEIDHLEKGMGVCTLCSKSFKLSKTYSDSCICDDCGRELTGYV